MGETAVLRAKALWAIARTYTRNTLLRKPVVLELNLVATNRCTQRCPMCNARVLEQELGPWFTIDRFRHYISKLEKYRIPTLSISGGEPTLVPDMPQILQEAAKRFPKITLMTNLYGDTRRISNIADVALRNNIDIICSFDGFGEVADRLRGAKHVARVSLANIRMLSRMKHELNSSSILMLNTVMSDDNLPQIPRILEFSKTIGWVQALAPVNIRDDQRALGNVPELHNSTELVKLCEMAKNMPHVKVLPSFLEGIPAYARGEGTKVCPYLTRLLRTLKIFLAPNGDVTLCDRKPIGNLDSSSLEEILKGKQYLEAVERFRQCKGCWLQCFVEPTMVLQPATLLKLEFLHCRVSSRENRPIQQPTRGKWAVSGTVSRQLIGKL